MFNIHPLGYIKVVKNCSYEMSLMCGLVISHITHVVIPFTCHLLHPLKLSFIVSM